MSDSKKIAIIGGDGVGPEVVSVGLRILETLKRLREYPLEFVSYDFGAERYMKDGTTFPDEAQRHIREECDAVLLGALGDPRAPSLEYARDILFGLRFGLDLYCNLRPVVCLADRLMPLKGRSAGDCNMMVFRENTEGIYVGIGGQFKKGTPDEVAISEDLNTRKGVERIIREAFIYAQAHGHDTVHMVDKHNAMKHAHELWIRAFREIGEEYPDIKKEHVFVDAMCLYLVQDPSRFKVVVTSNLFGDIVTDLGAALQGGMGMAASANLNPGKVSMFEPVHGSAPDIAGQDIANPLATVLTVGLLLSHLGWPEEEALLTDIVRDAISGMHCTQDVGGSLGTRATGDWVVAEIERRAANEG